MLLRLKVQLLIKSVYHGFQINLWYRDIDSRIWFIFVGGTRDLLEDIFPRPNRSKSFPIDPDNMHLKVSPQSSIDSDEDSSMPKFNTLTTKNTNPGMHGKATATARMGHFDET